MLQKVTIFLHSRCSFKDIQNSQKFITIQKQLLAGTLKKSRGLRVQCVQQVINAFKHECTQNVIVCETITYTINHKGIQSTKVRKACSHATLIFLF